jgi:hypothetical protein
MVQEKMVGIKNDILEYVKNRVSQVAAPAKL